jgi:hypothetical protein
MLNKANVPAGEDQSQPVTVLTAPETSAMIKQFLSNLYHAMGDTFVGAVKYLSDNGTVKLRITNAVINPDDFSTTTQDTDFALLTAGKLAVQYDPTTKTVTLSTDATKGGIIQAAFADFPATGDINFLYVATDTNQAYRWTGTAYEVVSERYTLPAEVLCDAKFLVVNVGQEDQYFAFRSTFVNTTTSATRTVDTTLQGTNVAFSYDEDNKIITVQTYVQHDDTLTGEGSVDTPLKVNPDRTTVNHGITMTGSGASDAPLDTDIDVAVDAPIVGTKSGSGGNRIYGKSIYIGIDNMKLLGKDLNPIEMSYLVTQTDFFKVTLRSIATSATSTPYVKPPNNQSGVITFEFPNSSGEADYIVDQNGVRWIERIVGKPVNIIILAENGYWKQNWSFTNVYRWKAWSPQDPAIYANTVGGFLADVYAYNSFNEHLEDENRHVTPAEQAAWNGIITDFNTHNQDAVRHITAAERTDWGGRVTQAQLSSEAQTRETMDNALQNQITALSALGRFLDTCSSYNGQGDTNSLLAKYSAPTDLPPLATVGDYVTITNDETHGGGNTIYRIKSIDLQNNTVTWVYDHTTATDTSGKADKVANALAGYVPTLDAAGNLSGQLDPSLWATKTALDTHIDDAVKHITAAERSGWDAKADKTALETEVTNRTTADATLQAGIETNATAIAGLLTRGGRYQGPFATPAVLPVNGFTTGDWAVVNTDTGSGMPAIYRKTGETGGQNVWVRDLLIPATILPDWSKRTVYADSGATGTSDLIFTADTTDYYSFRGYDTSGSSGQIMHIQVAHMPSETILQILYDETNNMHIGQTAPMLLIAGQQYRLRVWQLNNQAGNYQKIVYKFGRL